MRILFAGTPEIAVPSLRLLVEKHQVVGVLTNPDRPGKRGRTLLPSPVKEEALKHDLPVLQPLKLDADFLEEVKALKADLLVCVAFGKIFRKEFLDLFPLGGINLHPSALPEYRGASPLSAAIADGLKKTAISIQQLALKMDSGDILLQEALDIDPRETTGSLTDKAGSLGAPLLLQVVDKLEAGTIEARPQNEADATFCTLLEKDDGLIDWNLSAVEIDRLIRACSPWPGAFTQWDGQTLFIREAAPYEGTRFQISGKPGLVLGVDKGHGILVETKEGILAVTRLQLQSRKNLDYLSFLNGNRGFENTQLGE